MLAIFGDTKYNKFSNTKFEGTCVYGICRTKPAAGGLPAMRRPGWLSCARGRGAVLRGMRASARAVFAAGTSEIEKKKAGNVLTNITCLCFHYTIDEHGVSSLRKGRKCERNPSGVSFAFNSRPQASQSARQTAHQKRKARYGYAPRSAEQHGNPYGNGAQARFVVREQSILNRMSARPACAYSGYRAGMRLLQSARLRLPYTALCRHRR